MFKKIMLAYDGSETSSAALQKTAELARFGEAKVWLVGISRSDAITAYAEPYAHDYFVSEKTQVKQQLNVAADELRALGIEVTIFVGEGHPAYEIATQARIVLPDLLVIGHTDKGFLARWFEGSVGAHLINNLPCNMLIVTD